MGHIHQPTEPCSPLLWRWAVGADMGHLSEPASLPLVAEASLLPRAQQNNSPPWLRDSFWQAAKKRRGAAGPHGSDSVEETGQLATDTASECGHRPAMLRARFQASIRCRPEASPCCMPSSKRPSGAVQRRTRETELTGCASRERPLG